MVLVDSSHPQMFTRFAELGVEQTFPDRRIRPLILLLSHLGMPGRFKGNLYHLSPQVYNPVQAFLPQSRSGHYIQFDQPEAVIAAVRTVVGQCPPMQGP